MLNLACRVLFGAPLDMVGVGLSLPDVLHMKLRQAWQSWLCVRQPRKRRARLQQKPARPCCLHGLHRKGNVSG